MGVPFPAGELDNTIQFNTLSVVSGFLWHSSKYLSRLEVLACKLDPDFNYMITILQLCPSLNYYVKLWQILGGRWISKLGFQVYTQRQIH